MFTIDEQNKPMQELIAAFDPIRSPHPGSTHLEMFFCDPLVVMRDLSVAMNKVHRMIDDDDDDFRRGLGLGLER